MTIRSLSLAGVAAAVLFAATASSQSRPKTQNWLRNAGATDDYHYGKDYAISLATTACTTPLYQQCPNGRLVFPPLPYMGSGYVYANVFYMDAVFCSSKGGPGPDQTQYKCSISCATVCES